MPLLDCKTRWNSLMTMMKRFLELSNCIEKALIDCFSSDQRSLFPSPNELKLTHDLVQVLELIEVCVKGICRRDSNLYKAERAIDFSIHELKKLNSPYSHRFVSFLIKRITQLRQSDLVGTLMYLESYSSYEKYTKEFESDFVFPSKSEISVTIRDLLMRLFEKSSSPSSVQDQDTVDDEKTTREPMEKKSKTELMDEMDK